MPGNAGAIRAGKAYYELYAEKGQLQRDLKAAEGIVKASMAAVAALALTSLKTFASTGAELENIARRTGASAHALSSLGYAAKQTGSDLHGIAGLLTAIRDKTMEAARGSEQAQLSFYRLGINFLELSKLRPEDQLRLVADRLTAIENPAFRAITAIELLGSADMLPTLARLRELEAEAEKLGLTLSNETSAAAKKFDETMTALWESVKQVGIAIGETLAPTVTDLAQAAIGILQPLKEWIANHKDLVVTIAAVAAGVTVLIAALTAFSALLPALTLGLAALSAAFAVLTSPITLTVAAIAAASYAVVKLIEHFTDLKWSMAEVGRAFTGLKELWFGAGEAAPDVAGNLPKPGEAARQLAEAAGEEPPAANEAEEEERWLRRVKGFMRDTAGRPAPAAAAPAAAAKAAAAAAGGQAGISSALYHVKAIGANDVRTKEGFKSVMDSLSQINSPLLAIGRQQLDLERHHFEEVRRIRQQVAKIGVLGL